MLSIPFDIHLGNQTIRIAKVPDLKNIDKNIIPDSDVKLSENQIITPEVVVDLLIARKRKIPMYGLWEKLERMLFVANGIKTPFFVVSINRSYACGRTTLKDLIYYEDRYDEASLPSNSDIVTALTIEPKNMSYYEPTSVFFIYIYFKYRSPASQILKINNSITREEAFEKYRNFLKYLKDEIDGGNYDIDEIINNKCMEKRVFREGFLPREGPPLLKRVETESTLGKLGNPVHYKLNYDRPKTGYIHCHGLKEMALMFYRTAAYIDKIRDPLIFTSLRDIDDEMKKIPSSNGKCELIRWKNSGYLGNDNEIYINSILYKKAFSPNITVPCSFALRSHPEAANPNGDHKILIQDGYAIMYRHLITEVFIDSNDAEFLALAQLAAIKSHYSNNRVNLHVEDLSEDVIKLIYNCIENFNVSLYVHHGIPGHDHTRY